MRVRATTWRAVARTWLALVALGLAAIAAMSAHAAWRAIHAGQPGTAAAPVTSGYAAVPAVARATSLLQSGVAVATAPIPATLTPTGTTGTAPLPALPVSPALADAIVAANRGIVAAVPFRLAGSRLDHAHAAECLTAAIYYEAASESDDGERAVAQVVLNRVRHPAFPATVCGVVYQGSEHAGCQFSFACDGALARKPSASGWARAARIAGAALAGAVYAPVGLATHYHTYAVTPAWNRALVMTDAVGAHFFHRWKGYWGTAAAFSQRYRGIEPMPGPHAPLVDPTTDPVASSVTIAALAPVPPVSLMPHMAAPSAPARSDAGIQPAYRDAGLPRPSTGQGDNLPPASQVLDRWKDSGKPLF